MEYCKFVIWMHPKGEWAWASNTTRRVATILRLRATETSDFLYRCYDIFIVWLKWMPLGTMAHCFSFIDFLNLINGWPCNWWILLKIPFGAVCWNAKLNSAGAFKNNPILEIQEVVIEMWFSNDFPGKCTLWLLLMYYHIISWLHGRDLQLC